MNNNMTENINGKNELNKFNKYDTETIEILKKRAEHNCRGLVDKTYVYNSLKKTDIGFYFHIKDIPVAFICVNMVNDEELNIPLICSIKNNNNLGSELINLVFEYAKSNKYTKITLECDTIYEKFYKKFGFYITKRLMMDFIYMTKNID
jgi:hypothetical protein